MYKKKVCWHVLIVWYPGLHAKHDNKHTKKNKVKYNYFTWIILNYEM